MMSVREFERRLTARLETVLAAGLLGVFLTITVLVGMRYLFRTGLVGANELATMAFVYLSSVGAAVAVGREEHIRVDFLVRRLGPRGTRTVALLSRALVAVLNLAVVGASIPWLAATGHVPMPATQLPRFLAQASVPLGCGLAAVYCCLGMFRMIRSERPS